MLDNHDLNTLAEMVKSRLESLILQRAREEKADESSFDGEINKLYKLVAKLIIQANDSPITSQENNHKEGAIHVTDSQVSDERIEFIQSLREYWSDLTHAVNSAIQYTHNDNPQRSEYDMICVLLAQSIDNLRMYYTNIKKRPDDHGLYPFEPIKDIYQSFLSLGYNQTDQAVRASIREQITDSWRSMREPFLSEFNRTEPLKPVSRYIGKDRTNS